MIDIDNNKLENRLILQNNDFIKNNNIYISNNIDKIIINLKVDDVHGKHNLFYHCVSKLNNLPITIKKILFIIQKIPVVVSLNK